MFNLAFPFPVSSRCTSNSMHRLSSSPMSSKKSFCTGFWFSIPSSISCHASYDEGCPSSLNSPKDSIPSGNNTSKPSTCLLLIFQICESTQCFNNIPFEYNCIPDVFSGFISMSGAHLHVAPHFNLLLISLCTRNGYGTIESCNTNKHNAYCPVRKTSALKNNIDINSSFATDYLGNPAWRGSALHCPVRLLMMVFFFTSMDCMHLHLASRVSVRI